MVWEGMGGENRGGGQNKSLAEKIINRLKGFPERFRELGGSRGTIWGCSSLAERLLWEQDAGGSIPSIPTICRSSKLAMPLASTVRSGTAAPTTGGIQVQSLIRFSNAVSMVVP